MLEWLTAALVIITAFYAGATFRILRANQQTVAVTREQIEASTRPYVAISPFTVPRNPILYLRIANSGKTAAKNLKLSIDRDFYQYGESSRMDLNLATMSAFSSVVDSFPPGAVLTFGLAQGFLIFGDKADAKVTPVQFQVTATYSYATTEVTEVTQVDLRPYVGAMSEPSPLLDELEKIRRILER